MELGGEKRLCFMFHPFICVVIYIDEERFPLLIQSIVVYCKSVILRGYVCFVGTNLQHRLVMTSVSVFEFIGISSGGQCHQLISQTYTKNWFVVRKRPSDVFNGYSA